MPRHPGNQDGTLLTVSLALVYVLCISCVRIWIRKGSYGSDDLVVLVATMTGFVHTALDFLALANGLGAPYDATAVTGTLPVLNAVSEIERDRCDILIAVQASIAGVVFFNISLYLTKCAALTFLSRLTKAREQILLYHVANALVAATGIVSILIVSIGCPSEDFYWNFHDNQHTLLCPSQVRKCRCPCIVYVADCSQSLRWQACTGLDIVTELLLLVLPVQLIWGLQMPLFKKAMIVTAFSLRVP